MLVPESSLSDGVHTVAFELWRPGRSCKVTGWGPLLLSLARHASRILLPLALISRRAGSDGLIGCLSGERCHLLSLSEDAACSGCLGALPTLLLLDASECRAFLPSFEKVVDIFFEKASFLYTWLRRWSSLRLGKRSH